jgi:hypothetical protein
MYACFINRYTQGKGGIEGNKTMLAPVFQTRASYGTFSEPLSKYVVRPHENVPHGVPRVKKGHAMSVQLVQLGSIPIQVTDGEFSTGFQVGYLAFKTDFQDQPATDEFLYTIIARTFTNVHHTDRYRAGYLVGFMTALCEQQTASASSLNQKAEVQV